MGTSENKILDLVDIVKSWIPRRSDPTNVSRDFWMPDQSCRVCYECDSLFTVFNRRHHCRLCGRVFCAKCTTNSIPAPSDEVRTAGEEGEKLRVCKFCFKRWELEMMAVENGTNVASPGLSPSPSATSLASTKSSCTCNSSSCTVGSTPYSTGPYQRVSKTSVFSPLESDQMDPTIIKDSGISGRSTNTSGDAFCLSPNQFGFCVNRSDDEDDDYGLSFASETRHFSHAGDYHVPLNIDEIENIYGSYEAHHEHNHSKSISWSLLPENFDTQHIERTKDVGKEADGHDGNQFEAPAHDVVGANAEPVDFENNGLLWLPPEPEDAEDEREAVLCNDDEEDEGTTGEWGYLRPSNSFGSGEYGGRDKSTEQNRKAMKSVVEGHFRALIAQLLQVENLPVGDEGDKESWLDIITSLSWEAAGLLKPDTSKGGGMDPGRYVKVKCIACGHCSESKVVKGVVCKKNVAHRRMMSKIDKPRFLIVGGALEYQRVSNLLSSVDTLLQQEMDHLKMAVAKIAAHHPDVLLVEKSVSRYAQEYLLAKGISLVLNIKRELLERIARCTGAQMVPSIDHLTSQKLGYCDMFHVEKFLEEHGSAGQGGKKLTKTLMFFEGCPKPLGCTILLKGANGDELKKVKHVVQYGAFAAYHLALETSFLADEGASLPELPLKSPVTVALPDKPSSFDRSISTIPGFSIQGTEKPSDFQPTDEAQKSSKSIGTVQKSNQGVVSGQGSSAPCVNKLSSTHVTGEDNKVMEIFRRDNTNSEEAGIIDNSSSVCFDASVALEQGVGRSHPDSNVLAANCDANKELLSLKQEGNEHNDAFGSLKEDFLLSPSDHQSILVSLSTRCVWKGTVCEQAHLFRIKYYGSFDKPLGRFLRDHLFDKNYRCSSCEMPSEAHVYCYTHRQGSLTISVKKLSEVVLHGEREGKIWMWHRCLRCPRTNGFPPATLRVVMSDAAWGLSFGKFLELSFSNHAAASRVARCGHSLHRDCLRFYGFGRMVACFRYASIDVHSVHLPPPKIEFDYDSQEWIHNEVNEVGRIAEILFTEVHNALRRISEKIVGAGLHDGEVKAPEALRFHVAELEQILQKESKEFENSLQKMLYGEVKNGQPVIDILEINRIRRQILFHSYIWDQRLINATSSSNTSLQEERTFIPKIKDKRVNYVEKLVEIDMPSKAGEGLSSCDSSLLETKPETYLNQGGIESHVGQLDGVHKGGNVELDLNLRKDSAIINEKAALHESPNIVRRSEGGFPVKADLSDSLDAVWTGKSYPIGMMSADRDSSSLDSTLVNTVVSNPGSQNGIVDNGTDVDSSLNSELAAKGPQSVENCTHWVGAPFPSFYSSFNRKSSLNSQKLGINEYVPVYISLFRDLEQQSGARLLLPVGVNDTVIPVYDDEPTSIIAYALVSFDYHAQMSELENPKDSFDSSASSPLFDSVNLLSLGSFDDSASDAYRNLGSTDENILSMSRSRGSEILDPVWYTKDLHARVSFTDYGPLGKAKYTVTCYFAKRFETLRRSCCPSELDFIRSLSRCKKWGAQGGKSNVFFAKTLDDRFIIKQVTKTELESFIKFGPAYFKYLSNSISTRSPSCLAKILGIFQVSTKHLKGGKETKMDVLVMENLLFRRNVTRLYDLKGSSRSRYNPDTTGSNKVLLDQNLIEAMPTSPIFVGNKAKRSLERAVWNDTSFLASIDVMDYSLLVGVDEERHELVLGIIDFMRQYTWDKHLETWVKTSGILGGPRNATPTVISPQQYKKRFRKAMTAYFLMVPDQWSPPTIIPSESRSELCEESLQGRDLG